MSISQIERGTFYAACIILVIHFLLGCYLHGPKEACLWYWRKLKEDGWSDLRFFSGYIAFVFGSLFAATIWLQLIEHRNFTWRFCAYEALILGMASLCAVLCRYAHKRIMISNKDLL